LLAIQSRRPEARVTETQRGGEPVRRASGLSVERELDSGLWPFEVQFIA